MRTQNTSASLAKLHRTFRLARESGIKMLRDTNPQCILIQRGLRSEREQRGNVRLSGAVGLIARRILLIAFEPPAKGRNGIECRVISAGDYNYALSSGNRFYRYDCQTSATAVDVSRQRAAKIHAAKNGLWREVISDLTHRTSLYRLSRFLCVP